MENSDKNDTYAYKSDDVDDKKSFWWWQKKCPSYDNKRCPYDDDKSEGDKKCVLMEGLKGTYLGKK